MTISKFSEFLEDYLRRNPEISSYEDDIYGFS